MDAMPFEQCHHRWCWFDYTAGVILGLSIVISGTAFFQTAQLPVYQNGTRTEIDIFPAQAKYLALPHAGKQRHNIQVCIRMPGSIKCIHQCCDLFIAQWLYRRTPCLRQITNVGRIGAQIADQHSLLQSAVQNAVDFLDSFSCQTLCKHLVDKFLYQYRCDCIEAVSSQKRFDVIFTAVSVGADRKR